MHSTGKTACSRACLTVTAPLLDSSSACCAGADKSNIEKKDEREARYSLVFSVTDTTLSKDLTFDSHRN